MGVYGLTYTHLSTLEQTHLESHGKDSYMHCTRLLTLTYCTYANARNKSEKTFVSEMCKEAKKNFYQQKISKNVGNQKVLFKVVNDLLYRGKNTVYRRSQLTEFLL